MPSTMKCPSCGGVVLSNEKTCPHCGVKNTHYTEDSPRRIFNPKTIEELNEYCAERGMPLLRMRFFVGEDYREPKAFGIYKADEQRYVVYKNKADGTRAVRYDGPDEAFAVKELFDKLLSECHNRGIYPDGVVQRASNRNVSPKAPWYKEHPEVFAFLFFAIIIALSIVVPRMQERAKINQEIESFSQSPNTYDSVYIGGQYYTYDLNSNQLVSSSYNNDHLNDGYYLGSFSDEHEVYYRDGKTWHVYNTLEKDWKESNKPDYLRLGRSLDYRGAVWQSLWDVPDISSFPVKSGYYSYGTDCYFREYNDQWYVYQDGIKDWTETDCPVKQGIPAEDVKYRTEDYLVDMKPGIRSFKESTPYAVENGLSGYYQQGNKVYYHHRTYKYTYIYSSKTGIFRWPTGKYNDYWYSFDPDRNDWFPSSRPSDDSLTEVYLGDSYQTAASNEWNEDWNTTDFKSSLSWQVIAGNEAIEDARNTREAKERYEEYEKEKNRDSRYNSDYDDWDYNDTDWDSDW